MDHLDIFEDLIAAISMDGVPEHYLLCKLFKHSLVGEASHWLKQLPSGSLTSWTDIQKVFLREFFGEARAQEIRDKNLDILPRTYRSFQKLKVHEIPKGLSTSWFYGGSTVEEVLHGN